MKRKIKYLLTKVTGHHHHHHHHKSTSSIIFIVYHHHQKSSSCIIIIIIIYHHCASSSSYTIIISDLQVPHLCSTNDYMLIDANKCALSTILRLWTRRFKISKRKADKYPSLTIHINSGKFHF